MLALTDNSQVQTTNAQNYNDIHAINMSPCVKQQKTGTREPGKSNKEDNIC